MPASWTIGSAPDCDLRVEQAKVSGRHCRLSVGERGYVLEDLGSTNGTYVNGARIAGPVLVTRGDLITLGLTTPLPWPADDSSGDIVKLRIGRAADNDFVIDNPLVSGHHAQVCWERNSGLFFLEDLGAANGTALGSPERKVARSRLTPGDTVYLGTYPIAAIQLLARLDPAQVPTVPLRKSAVVIGRSPECDLPLDLPMISNRHARAYRKGGITLIEDLNSANGTFLNGQRVAEATPVLGTDLISLGSYTFRLAYDPPAEALATAKSSQIPPGLVAELDLPGSSDLTGNPVSGFAASKAKPTRHQGILVGLIGQAPVLAVAMVVALGGMTATTGQSGSPSGLASVLFGLSVATIWFGLSSGVVLGLFGPQRSVRGGVPLLLPAGAAAIQAMVAWGIVAWLLGLRGASAPSLMLVILGSAVGTALGVLISTRATHRLLVVVASASIMAATWLFGSGPNTLPRALPWTKAVADFAPSRWVFEGLLVLEADIRGSGVALGGVPTGEPTRDLAEDYFPAATDRMGAQADLCAIGLMLLGLVAVVAYLTWTAGPVSRTAPGATRVDLAG